jgi:hypothetical protein
MSSPLLEQPNIVALHQLKAAADVRFDPTINVPQTIRYHSALFSKTGIHGCRIVISKPLDYHVEHVFPFITTLADLPGERS